MRYFTVTNNYLTPKNNLAKEIQALFMTADRVILKDDQAKAEFIQSIKDSVESLNAKHPRCNAIQFETYSFHFDNCLTVSARSVVSLKIYTEQKWKGGDHESD